MTNKKAVVYLGYHAFPYGLAEVQKIILISKSLLIAGNKVTVVCRNGYHDKAARPELKAHGFFEGIEYVYVSGSAHRNKGFFKRRMRKIKGLINEARFLMKRRKQNNLDCAILSTGNFYSVLYYFILSRLIGFKTILNYVEHYSSMNKKRFEASKQLNDILFDKYAPALTTASFVISEFLIEHIKKVSPNKKYLKIPGLTDFEKYNGIEDVKGENYFLYCGSAAYKEIILFSIDSFGLLNDSAGVFLYLVINGLESDVEVIRRYIDNHSKKENIRVFSGLTEKQLYTYYKNALALLIPLRPTFQDMARFPHKTGEYLASGNPVISTNYGEMKKYFRDMENMFLAEHYEVNQFAAKMQCVIHNPDRAKKIGVQGKNIASDLFDYRNRAKVIHHFLETQL